MICHGDTSKIMREEDNEKKNFTTLNYLRVTHHNYKVHEIREIKLNYIIECQHNNQTTTHEIFYHILSCFL